MLAPYYKAGVREAGCDEAGRGCMAGPVFAAAVILPPEFSHPLLDDSKQMTRAHREEVRSYIEAHALAWAVALVPPAVVDKMNVLWASVYGMHRALDQLTPKPELILVDGPKFKNYVYRTEDPDSQAGGIRELAVPHQCFVKGDGRFAAIAAASVLAKTHRDAYMEKAALSYPEYGWEQNKGYPTPAHKAAMQRLGLTPLHRRSFHFHPEEKTLF